MKNITTRQEFLNEGINLKQVLIGLGILANFTLLSPLLKAEDDPQKKIGASTSASAAATIVSPIEASLKNDTIKTNDVNRQYYITRDGKNITLNYE
jgi:hypothetical protein